jgi:hypothetical protein
MRESLSPLDYVCVDIIQMWLRKANQGKGGRVCNGVTWVKVSTDDMLGYLEYRNISASYKQVQRSLRRIADLKVLDRAKLNQSRWDHSYWWSFSCPPDGAELVDSHSVQSDPDGLPETGDFDRSEVQSEPLLNTPPLSPTSFSPSVSVEEDRLEEGRNEGESEQGNLVDEVLATFTACLPEGSSLQASGLGERGTGQTIQDPTEGRKSSYERVRDLASRYTPPEQSGAAIVEVGGKRYVVSDGQCGPLR